MVIVNYKAGQLCNRLFHFAHFISNSVEHRYKLLYPYFDEYCKYFDSTKNNDFGVYGISIRYSKNRLGHMVIKKIVQMIGLLVGLLRKESFLDYYFHNIVQYERMDADFNLNAVNYVDKAKSRVVLVKGWRYRDPENFKKHSQLIKTIFTPIKEYLDEVDKVISECKKNGDLIIGIHIRRGDYRYYNHGKWYFEDSIYHDKMSQLDNIMQIKKKKCVFLLCSNETINEDNFKNLNVVIQKRHFIVDLYSLARCDYIIGPPSTFTMWASFYGDVPLLMIGYANKKISLSDFKVET